MTFMPRYAAHWRKSRHLRYFTILLTLMFEMGVLHSQTVTDSIWNDNIKTVSLTRGGIELEAPIIMIGSSDRVVLRFDLLAAQATHFRYRISHCDADWHPDHLAPADFISGFEDGSIDNYQFSFTTMHSYVNYYHSIPSEYTSFIASGNYILTIYPTEYPDSIVLTRRFMVTEELIDIEATSGKPSGPVGDMMRDQELNVALTIKEGSPIPSSPQYLHVVAWQNNRRDLVRTLPFSGYQRNQLMYRWKEANVFPGGNCFRYFDISNLRSPMYNVQRIEEAGGVTMAFLRPEEDRSRKNYSFVKGLNGGMKVNIWDRNDPQTEADYAWVNFSLPMDHPRIDGTIHIIGDLSDWCLDERSQMEWQPRYKAYTKRMLLKQGYYSYQLVFLPTGATTGQTSVVEGDHYETPNSYTICVYLRQPGALFDRLIAVRQIHNQ